MRPSKNYKDSKVKILFFSLVFFLFLIYLVHNLVFTIIIIDLIPQLRRKGSIFIWVTLSQYWPLSKLKKKRIFLYLYPIFLGTWEFLREKVKHQSRWLLEGKTKILQLQAVLTIVSTVIALYVQDCKYLVIDNTDFLSCTLTFSVNFIKNINFL